MTDLILIDGVPKDAAWLDERAYQFGDGLFETIAVRDGRPCLWQGHMQRLLTGCERLNLPLPDVERFYRECLDACHGQRYAIAKLYWTGGRSARGYGRPDDVRPRRILRVFGSAPSPMAPWWDLATSPHRLGENATLAQIKHLNRLDQVIARSGLTDGVTDECLMLGQDGRVISGSMSNLFIESAGKLRTPDLATAGIAGVVRELVLKLGASADCPVEIDRIEPAESASADALYLTNSLIGVVRVRSLDDSMFNTDWQMHPVMQQAAQRCHRPDAPDTTP